MREKYFALLVLLTLALPACGGSGGGGGDNTQTARLRIKNSCGYTIWVQHTNDPSGINEVSQLTSGQYVDYTIPDAGRASDRFWHNFINETQRFQIGSGDF